MFNRILITVVVAVFIALLGIGIIVPILPVLATKLGASGFALGLITAAFSLSRGLCQPVVGNLSDRWGRKGFMVVGLFIYGLVGLLVPLAESVPHLVVIRLFQGFGAAMIVPVAMAYASFLSPPGEEGRYMGVVNVAVFCGTGFGPVLGGYFADNWGMASVFHMMAGLCFCAFILVLFNMPACSPIDRPQRISLLANIGLMLRRRRTVGILLARFATVLMMVPTMAFLPVMMAGWPGSSGMQAGLVITCRTLMNAVLQYPFGALTDRSDKVVLLLSGSFCMCAAVALIPLMNSLGAMIGMYLFLGFGEAVLWPVLGAYAVEEGRNLFGHGTMMGVFNLAMSGGVFTGALLAGLSMDGLGVRHAFWATGGVIVILCSLAAYLIRSGENAGETGEEKAMVRSLPPSG
ncbi:MAG: MFS transporter [Proteobacteria bacterium]|nr:MFS transporter [Pseudomonadota bacterium]